MKKIDLDNTKLEFNLLIFMIVGSVIALIIDIKFNTVNDTSLNNLTPLLLAGLLGISTVFFSCYFLLIQLYQNRYPMELIKNEINKVLRCIIFIIVFSIIYGSILTCIESGLFMQLWFDIVAITTIVIIMFVSYKSNKKLMINTYINKYIEKIKQQLENSICDIDKLKQTFVKIKNVFEECYVKDEYHVCQNISDRIGQVFQSLIEEQNKMLLNGKIEVKEADNLYEEIISYSIYQIDISKNSDCEYFIEDLINNNYHNILSCIKTQQFNLYKKYIRKINKKIYDFQKNEYDLQVNLFFKMYSKISKELINQDNYNEWLEYLFDDLYKMTMSLNYINNNANLKHFAQLLVLSLLDSLDSKKDLYNYLFDLFKKFSKEAVKINHRIDEMIVYYTYYSSELILKENLLAIKEFNEIIFEIEDDLINEPKCVDFIYYYLSSINEQWEKEFSDLVRQKNVKILMDLISLDLNNNYNIMLPNFKDIIKKSNYDLKITKDICNDFYSLFNRAILKNNNSIFYLFSEKLNDSIISLEKESKDVQKSLFTVYINVLVRVSKIENKLFKEITFMQLMKCIEEMDKKKSVSSDFGDFIIKNISNVARDNFSYGATIIRDVISLLYKMMYKDEALNFVINSEDKKYLVCRTIFNIGIDAIENNQEESLRQVSNALGWLTIDSIERGNDSIVKYLLNKSNDLLKLSKSLSISNKTLTFIMTLFTTVGTYCCKNPKTYKYRSIIINALLDEDDLIINTAIKLRTCDNDNWNSLFDNKTKEFTKEFLKNYKKEKQKYKANNMNPFNEVAID